MRRRCRWARVVAVAPRPPTGVLSLCRDVACRRGGNDATAARSRPRRPSPVRRSSDCRGTGRRRSRCHVMAGRALTGAEGRDHRGARGVRSEGDDGRRRPERQRLARRRQCVRLAGECRRYQPDRRRRGVPGPPAGAGRRGARNRAARADRDAAEPPDGDRLVTPWLAAAAMSSSSLLVLANSFRVRGQLA